MAKRFTDTEKFNDKWYRNLSLLHKAIWEFLLAECNHAGILEKFDIDLMSFKIGATVTLDDLKSFGDRIIFISDEVLFIPKFIKFQYEGKLNPENRVHASVLKELEKWGINAPSKPLTSPIQGAKDKDKNKDKNISSLVLSSLDEEKISPEEKTERVNPDFYFSDEKEKLFTIYAKECPNLIPLTGEKRNRRILDKANTFLDEINNNWKKYIVLCQKANELKEIAKTKIDFETMINCHIGILNGKYQNKASPSRGISADFINSYFNKKINEEKIEDG